MLDTRELGWRVSALSPEGTLDTRELGGGVSALSPEGDKDLCQGLQGGRH